ncbi:hypothetical protein TW79_17295 [Tritonibacter mobilis]|uniref:Uncharacterized protein n=1 Tax=Tritonibacter mobilis F1926 TaxID=1265309 RepID=A0A1B1A756_9RHOB|nr:hypothetical protein K529_016435 [Tritonibacter mobilis F1926]KJZ22704.1 hypothetical protein TW79_17295 [Tritonibacter mobilis]
MVDMMQPKPLPLHNLGMPSEADAQNATQVTGYMYAMSTLKVIRLQMQSMLFRHQTMALLVVASLQKA